MTNHNLVQTTHHSIAVRRRGSGPPIVLIHGNSCSKRCFDKQFESALAERFELLAIDLPGHGDSPPAAAPEETYSLPGHAGALAEAVSALEVDGAVFVGWSLGGHVLLEASARLSKAAGLMIFGAPPVATFGDFAAAVTDDPAMQAAFKAESSDAEARALLSILFRPGYATPQQFFDDFRRTDPRARALLGASAAEGRLQDEVQIVGELRVPLAVVHGVHEQLVKRPHFDGLSMPTLWRGAVQEVPEAGHATHWENPEAFNRLLEEFAGDCLGEA